MAQVHRFTALTQDAAISENGLYDAGWLATCQCGTDIWVAAGCASKADTLRALSAHFTRNGVDPAVAFLDNPDRVGTTPVPHPA